MFLDRIMARGPWAPVVDVSLQALLCPGGHAVLWSVWRSLKLVNMHQLPNSLHLHSNPKIPSLDTHGLPAQAELDKHPSCSQYYGNCHLSGPSDASSHFELGFSPHASGHLIPTSTASVVGYWSVAKVQKDFHITILCALGSSLPSLL